MQIQENVIQEAGKRLCTTVIRRDILQMIHRAGSGHPGGSLSAVEILCVLYGEIMRVDPKQPGLWGRDRFILSKGHAAPALYAVLARMGYFHTDELLRLRRKDGILQGHPDMKLTPGVDFSSGSLGQGLSAGLGMVLAKRHTREPGFVYVLLGDGELNEGQVWEAAMAASKFAAGRLTAIVDRNHVQLDGTSEEIMPLGDLTAKWRAFGWTVRPVNGHDRKALGETFRQARRAGDGRPQVILAETVKGKGVSFMENNCAWHGGIMTPEQYRQAMAELDRTAEEETHG